MVRTCIRDRSVWILLLALGFFSASSGTPERQAYRNAEALWNRGDWRHAELALREGLAKTADRNSKDAWQMRLWLADALIAQTKFTEAAEILAPEPPAALQHSASAVNRLLIQAILEARLHGGEGQQRVIAAEALAKAYQPQLLADVYGRRALIDKDPRDKERDLLLSLRLARRQHHRIFEINALGSLGVLRTKERRFDEALHDFHLALAEAQKADAQSKIEKISGNVGWTLITIGDFVGASEALRNAVAICRSINAEYDLAPWLDNLGRIALHDRDYRNALGYFDQCLAVARGIPHPDLAEFLEHRAAALVELGDLAGAIKANEEARSHVLRNDPQQLRAADIIDARIDAASGDAASAIAKIRRVIQAAQTPERWEPEARLAEFLVAARRPAEAADEFARALATAAEARKSISDEELRLSFGALVREFNEEYVDLLVSEGRIAEALDVVERSRAQTLAEALGTEAEPREIDPQELAANRDAVILSYWLTPKRAFVWTITAAGIKVTPLGPGTTIEEALDKYARELPLLSSGDTIKPEGAALYAKLVRPVAKQIGGAARVIVIPDGRLQAFNPETLVDPSTGAYWIESVVIETAPSLSLLDRPVSEPRTSMLLIGDPPSHAPEFPALRNAADEINRVRSHFAGECTVLRGTAATPRAYHDAHPGDFGNIHFVAHGIATRTRPLDSAVVLAGTGDSYKLYARDILKQPLRAALVTISSCHGAGTRLYEGEGLVGLAWAFLHAGASKVIAALWEVNDIATPKLMDDLYAGIRAGQDPAAALRNAKLKLIHNRKSAFRQPKYWAPFVLYSGS